MRRVYLDWNATAPTWPAVQEAMGEALATHFGNASSVHYHGQRSRSVIENARRSLERAVGAMKCTTIFTGGATEANNQVLLSHLHRTEHPSFVSSSVEHPSVLEVLAEMGRQGAAINTWPVDPSGRLDLSWLQERLRSGTTCVSVMWANNETGNIHPIAEIAEMVEGSNALLHVDATQAIGRIPLQIETLAIDYLTLSFHKCGGPKGVGAILARNGRDVDAAFSGGHQERGRRPGTENVPAIAGVGTLVGMIREKVGEWQDQCERLRESFLRSLDSLGGWEVRGDALHRLPNTVNLAFDGVDGEDLLLAMDLEGISLSSGSACTAGSLEPSHVILAMRPTEQDARRSIRLSFGPSTTEEELVYAGSTLIRVVQRLRTLNQELPRIV